MTLATISASYARATNLGKIYRISERVTCDGIEFQHIIIVAGETTNAYPCSSRGAVISWGELPGSISTRGPAGAVLDGFISWLNSGEAYDG